MSANTQRVLEESQRFRARLPSLVAQCNGRWVVFLDGEVKATFDDEEEAYVWGVKTYGVRDGFVIARVASDACDPVDMRPF